MDLLDILRGEFTADAFGQTADECLARIKAVLDASEDAVSDLDPDRQDRAALALSRVSLYGAEARFIRRALTSGSGAEGSFSRSDLAARLTATLEDRDRAQSEYDRLTASPVAAQERRSLSVPMVVEP